MRALTSLVVCAAVVALTGCEEERIQTIQPDLVVQRTLVDFGVHRVGAPSEESLVLRSQSLAAINVSGLAVEDDPDAPGGAAAFAVSQPVTGVEGEGEATVKLRFTPPSVADFSAFLVITSDDPDDGRKRVKLTGRGAMPKIRVTASCNPPCTGFTAVETPPSIDFGERPPLRRDASGKLINEPVWPEVTILNDGEIPLKLARVEFEGDPAFSSKGVLPTGGFSIDQGSGQVIRVVFDPKDPRKDHAAELVLVSDDPEQGEIKVKLTGRKADNAPPDVCAAIVKVDQPDGSEDFPVDGTGKRAFGGAISVQPASTVFLSSFSDYYDVRDPVTQGDPSLCTTDVEDGRALLSFQWSVEERPRESKAVIIGAGNAQPSFKPDAIGHYKLKLEVKDSENAVSSTFVEFDAIPKRDLVVQLTWENQPNIDLDVHLVRPSCGNKPTCVFDPVADINGYSWLTQNQTFEWGNSGIEDDPRLDFDDQGQKALIENVNLNFPENDAACKTGTGGCVYDVYVHYFKDTRTTSGSAPSCSAGCRLGDTCNCTGGAVCVSDRCVQPVKPTVKIFIRPTPELPGPDFEIPLPPEVVELGAPCFLWHVAQIRWPSKQTVDSTPPEQLRSLVTITPMGTASAPIVDYVGSLPVGGFACTPNASGAGGNAEYVKQPWENRPEYP